MTAINGVTNPFENAVNSTNYTQLGRQQLIANYSQAISLGYQPPPNILQEISDLLALGTLTPATQARLQGLIDTIAAELAPVITSDGGGDTASISIPKDTIYVTTVVAIDNYSANGTNSLVYSISGADASLFDINTLTGNLSFKSAAVFNAGGDNIYDVKAEVHDGGVLIDMQTLTITVTNDAPMVALVTTDSDAKTLIETNAGLTTSGTLTVTDADLSDRVSSSVSSVVATGNTAGLGLSNAQLLAMMTVAPVSGLAADPGDQHNLSWTFNSGTQAFDYLSVGQSLVLTYTVHASDNSGASDDQPVTITITGTADGPLDIAGGMAVIPYGIVGLGVLLNNGDGTFAAVTLDSSGSYTLGFAANNFAVGDFNGDGALDTVTGSFQSASVGGVEVLLNNGDGTFASTRYNSGTSYASPPQDHVQAVAVGDFNGDGALDIVAGCYVSAYVSGSVALLLNNGDGSFHAAGIWSNGAHHYPNYESTLDIAVGDINADGYLDIAVAIQPHNPLTGPSGGGPDIGGPDDAYIPGSVGVLYGNGDGTFETAVNLPVMGVSVTDVALGEFWWI